MTNSIGRWTPRILSGCATPSENDFCVPRAVGSDCVAQWARIDVVTPSETPNDFSELQPSIRAHVEDIRIAASRTSQSELRSQSQCEVECWLPSCFFYLSPGE